MARIAIGGLQHETNTFAPAKADYAAFEAGGGWPGVQYGDLLFDAVAGANIPAQGAIAALRSSGHTLAATAWAAASPSAHVTNDAFERIAGELVRRLQAAGPVDGIYLDLHGAMVTEAHDDGEGELLRRVRQAVGPRVPIAASLDLHANMTRGMFETADALVAYRSYPHVDMAETGARAARLLERMLRTGEKLAHRHCDSTSSPASRRNARSWSRDAASIESSVRSKHGTASCCRSRRAFRWRISTNAEWRCSATGRTRRTWTLRWMRCA